MELIEKDFGYTLAAAGQTAASPMLAAARSVFLTGVEKELVQENMTAVAKLYERA